MRLFVTGTDTDVGKTVFAAALAAALDATYWKPIQAGSLERTDSDTVRQLSGLPPDQILTEGYRLNTACSPHLASELDSVMIYADALTPPPADPLVIEGAGGLMVPITRGAFVIDLIARWHLPVVLVARTAIGTINHSLLSISALRARDIPLMGVAFIGESAPDSEEIICTLGQAKRLGRLPFIAPLNRDTLRRAFTSNFDLNDFR